MIFALVRKRKPGFVKIDCQKKWRGHKIFPIYERNSLNSSFFFLSSYFVAEEKNKEKEPWKQG